MNTKRLFLAVVILIMGLGGCSPSSDDTGSIGSDAPRAWFDAPLPGTIYWPPNPCAIVAHGASPSGIAVFELFINGTAVSVPSPDTGASLVTLTRDCTVSAPGAYALQLRAQDNSGAWSGYAETYFIIPGDDGELAPPPAVETVLPVVPGPTLTSVPSVSNELSITEVSNWVVYVGDSSCGPMETVITAHATASKGVAAVILFYRFGSGGFQDISMNPIGNDLYQGTLNMSSIFGGSIPFDSAIPEYQVIVQQNDGDTSLRTPVLADIEVKACAPVDNSGGTDACSAFVDQRACVANGCNWWEIAGTPPSFVCKSKP